MRTITPNDLQKRLNNGETMVLLDVREKEELCGELGHIKNIVHIPLGELQARSKEVPTDKQVVTICKMGGRATRAAEFLEACGVKDVLVMEGGMTGWNECSLPVAKPESVG